MSLSPRSGSGHVYTGRSTQSEFAPGEAPQPLRQHGFVGPLDLGGLVEQVPLQPVAQVLREADAAEQVRQPGEEFADGPLPLAAVAREEAGHGERPGFRHGRRRGGGGVRLPGREELPVRRGGPFGGRICCAQLLHRIVEITVVHETSSGVVLLLCVPTGERSQQILFEHGGLAATREIVYRDENVTTKFPYATTLLEAIRRTRPRPLTPHYTEFSAEFRKVVTEAWSHDGEITPAQAARLTDALQGKAGG